MKQHTTVLVPVIVFGCIQALVNSTTIPEQQPGKMTVPSSGVATTSIMTNNHKHKNNDNHNNKTMTDVNVIEDDTNAQRTVETTWTEHENGGAPGPVLISTVATSPGSTAASTEKNSTPTAATLSSDRADQQVNSTNDKNTMEVSQNDNSNSAITKTSVTFSKDTASNDNMDKPLGNVKFAEEGSTVAAVMDVNIDNNHVSGTPTTPNQTTSSYAIDNKSSSGALPTATLSSISTNNRSALPATVSPLSSPVAAAVAATPSSSLTTAAAVVLPSPSQQQQEEEVLEGDPNNNSSSQVNNGNNRSATMGTNVAIAPPPQVKEVSVAILQDELVEAPVATTTTTTTSSGADVDVPAVVVKEEEIPRVGSPVASNGDLDNENPDNKQEDNKKDLNYDDVDVNNAVDEDPSAAVTLSPAWSESTDVDDADFLEVGEVNDPNTLSAEFETHKATNTIPSISPSFSSDSSVDGAILMMTPSKSDLEHGIILPPSCSSTSDSGIMRSPSPPRVVSPSPGSFDTADTAATTSSPMITMSPSYKHCETPVAATVAITTPASAPFCQLTSLPIDALHCIASFLTPMEMCQYGQTCTAASKVGREIFRRVRMHGFRCATEVITAWVRTLLYTRCCKSHHLFFCLNYVCDFSPTAFPDILSLFATET